MIVFSLTACGAEKVDNSIASFGEKELTALLGIEKSEVISSLKLNEDDYEVVDEYHGVYAVTSETENIEGKDFKIGIWFFPGSPDSFFGFTYDLDISTYSDNELKELLTKLSEHLISLYGEPKTFSGRPNRIQDMDELQEDGVEYWLAGDSISIPAFENADVVKDGSKVQILQAELEYVKETGRLRIEYVVTLTNNWENSKYDLML